MFIRMIFWSKVADFGNIYPFVGMDKVKLVSRGKLSLDHFDIGDDSFILVIDTIENQGSGYMLWHAGFLGKDKSSAFVLKLSSFSRDWLGIDFCCVIYIFI
ncbi:MAG: hypothetical protein WCJ39_06265 [bacterium]